MLVDTFGLVAALHAEAPEADRTEMAGLYDFLVGDWRMQVVTYPTEGGRFEAAGEIHAGWVLEGRAIQDTWILPARDCRQQGAVALPVAGTWFGTTLRIYDTALHAWRIYWINPPTNTFREQIGRARDGSIVQEGSTADGALSRWTFTDIGPASFHWSAELSRDRGDTWRLLIDVLARRDGGSLPG